MILKVEDRINISILSNILNLALVYTLQHSLVVLL